MGLAERDYRRRPFDSNYGTIRAWSATTWLIAVLVAVFLIDALLTPPIYFPQVMTADGFDAEAFASGAFLVRMMAPLSRHGHFSAATVLDAAQYWRVATFPFIHTDVWPLFLNVVCLYAFARVLEEEIGPRRLLMLVAACALAAPVAYVALYKAGVAIDGGWRPLLGASSVALGVTMVVACVGPDDQVVLWTTGLSVRRRVLAWTVAAALAVIVLKQDSTGANAAHLGGAAAGLLAVPFLRRAPER
jgi:membrane associated rhomboid family serine protease